MSRLLIKPIPLPVGISASLDGTILNISQTSGALERIQVPSTINISVSESSISVSRVLKKDPMNGTFYANLRNMILDITNPFSMELFMTGVEYKASVSGSQLFLSVGYSHDLVMTINPALKVSVSGQKILISGKDRLLVSQFSSKISNLKKPEPYGGKGISVFGSFVFRKEVKSSK
jgi:large subunit ribosomal protein L6